MIIINKFRFCILIVLCIIAFNYTSLTAQHPPCSGSVSIEVGTIVELEGGYNADIEITDPPADLEVVTLTVSITGDEVIILYKDDDSNKFNTNTNISSNLTDHVVDNVGDAYFLDPPQNFPSLNLSNGEILFTVPYSAIADSDVDIEITNALIYTDGAFCVPTTVDATNESVGHVDATGNIEKKGGPVCDDTSNNGVDAEVNAFEEFYRLGSSAHQTETSSIGNYTSTIVPGGDYEITPQKEDDPNTPQIENNPGCGICSNDIFFIRQHFLMFDGGWEFTKYWKLMAADADGSGELTTIDMQIIRRVQIFGGPGFPGFGSWRFVDQSHYDFNHGANDNNNVPITTNNVEDYPQTISLTDIQSNSTDNNFYGVKIGDVTGNCTACEGPFTPCGTTMDYNLGMDIPPLAGNLNDTLDIPLVGTDSINAVIGSNFAFEYSDTSYKFIEVTEGNLIDTCDILDWDTLNNKLHLTWVEIADTNGVNFTKSDTIAILKFKQLVSSPDSMDFIFSDSFDNFHVDTSLTFYDLNPDIEESRGYIPQYNEESGFDVYPNPAQNELYLTIDELELVPNRPIIISNIQGKILDEIDSNIAIDGNRLMLDVSRLPINSIYFCRIMTKSGPKVIRFVK